MTLHVFQNPLTFNRKYIDSFKWWIFQPVMLVFLGVDTVRMMGPGTCISKFKNYCNFRSNLFVKFQVIDSCFVKNLSQKPIRYSTGRL